MSGVGRKAFWDERRENFATALAAGFKPEEAGKLVGYSAANARRNARRKDVMARVAELKAPAVAKVQEQIAVNIAFISDQLMPIAQADLGKQKIKPIDKLRALEDLAKLYGLNAPDKSEITGKDGGPVYVISERPMSEEEWEKQRASSA